MNEPKIEIILDKTWNNSHVLINGEEIPVTKLEIAPMDGGHPMVRVRLEVIMPFIKVSPATLEIIEEKIKKSKVK